MAGRDDGGGDGRHRQQGGREGVVSHLEAAAASVCGPQCQNVTSKLKLKAAWRRRRSWPPRWFLSIIRVPLKTERRGENERTNEQTVSEANWILPPWRRCTIVRELVNESEEPKYDWEEKLGCRAGPGRMTLWVVKKPF